MGEELEDLRIVAGKQAIKDQLLKSAELIAPFFKNRKKNDQGNSPRYINVKDIDFIQIDKGDSIEYEIIVQLLSDQGIWTETILIREFNNNEDLEDEISRYGRLEQRCFLFPNIELAPMININRANFQIIYEKHKGVNIYQLGLSQKMVDVILGQITSLFHGHEVVDLERTTSKELIHFLISHLPFTDEERGSIIELLESHLERMTDSKGGYLPCSLLNPNKLKFDVMHEEDTTLDVIARKGGLLSMLSIEKPEDFVMDRMTDVATIFSNRAYSEFIAIGNVDQTKLSIENFFSGYNEISSKLGTPSLSDLYPKGITLDLQMLIGFFLVEIHKLHIRTVSDFENKDPIRYVYFLLTKFPFSLI